jgi:hypothetical protein
MNCRLLADGRFVSALPAASVFALAVILLPSMRAAIPINEPLRPSSQSAIGNQQSAISKIPTVGLEGRVEVVLPGTRLEARPVEHKAKMVLRIAETRPRGDALFYDLRYVGLVPGDYDLRNYLVRADGCSTNDLPPIPVSIAPLLPAKHDGQLVEEPVSALGRLGGYKALMIAAAVVWAALLVPLVWRRRKKVLVESAPHSEPSLAERLRPLVEQAAQGTLSRDGQAQLERMLLTHWRQRLGLEGLNMVEALARLREHPEAGDLLRALESWLHRPPGSATVDVNAMLAPYRSLPAAEVVGNSK